MNEHLCKNYDKTLLLYHLVFPVKYCREVFSDRVSATLKDICLGLSGRCEVYFVEIGMEENHVHFLVQSVPALSVTKIVKTIKSITAKQIFQLHPEVKRFLWGGNLRTSGFYANTVSEYANAEGFQQYIANQGAYRRIPVQRLTLDL